MSFNLFSFLLSGKSSAGVFRLFWPQRFFVQPLLQVQKLPTVAPFVDIVAQIEAVATVPEFSRVTHGDVVNFLTETFAVLAETFGVRSLVFV